MDLLRALGTFVRVVETGSFSAVARETGTSHTAATRLVGQLEDHFGVRLFHRTTRRLSLTEDGQDLLNHAHHLLETAQEMESTLGNHRSTPSGMVRIGITPAVATLLVPQLPRMFERFPGLSVDLVVSNRFGDLVEERLDLALQRGPAGDSSLVARAIGTFGRVLVASPAYLERRGAPTGPADLAQHSCVIHESGPDSAHWRFAGPDGPVDVIVSGPLHSDNTDVVHRAVLAGYGITMLPEMQVVDDIRAARLYRLLPDYPSGHEAVFVVYPSRRHLAPRTRVMIDFFVEMGRALETWLEEARVWGENETTWLV
jgi:DNA-binding transcriptional LysR family regulator